MFRNKRDEPEGLPSCCHALTGREDPFDELLPGHFAVLVLVNAAEEVHDAGLFVVHPTHVALPPHVKVEVGKFFQLQKQKEKIGRAHV